MEKQLACWIYQEDGGIYYCFDCCQARMNEINKNKEFSDSINFDRGEECTFFQDYADEKYNVTCCNCGGPLHSNSEFTRERPTLKRLRQFRNKYINPCQAKQ